MGRIVLTAPGITESPDIQVDGPGSGRGDWMVIVYNNETNTYAEVMAVLMMATNCDEYEAYIETWEVDHLGKSTVHYGNEDECFSAAAIIGSIGIQVEVRCED